MENKPSNERVFFADGVHPQHNSLPSYGWIRKGEARELKSNYGYPSKPFESLKAAIAWVEQFVDWYNNKYLHSGIKFVTPEERHNGTDKIVLARRKNIYELARSRIPSRWSNKVRNWERIEVVALNPDNKSKKTQSL